MIYIISEEKSSFTDTRYILFETNTDSILSIKEEALKRLIIETGIEVKNARLSGNEIIINQWYNGKHSEGAKRANRNGYILLCELGDDKYKLMNYVEDIFYMTNKQLIRYVKKNKVDNCIIENGRYKSLDTYTAIKNTQFEELMDKKYERYTTISAALGRKLSFDYIIKGEEVKIKRYTGTSKHVIIPSFVTAIMQGAFKDCEIEELTIDRGIKYIGSFAFEGCNISKLSVPETVELMGVTPFYGNKQIITNMGAYKEDKVSFLNNKVIMLDKYAEYMY